MTDHNTKKKEIIIYILINVLIFGIMLAINSVYPYSWDDKGIPEGFAADNWNLLDIISYTYHKYYLLWSGKLIPLSLALLFTVLDKTVYNIINSLMYVLFANTIYWFFWKKRFDPWMLVTIYASLWIFIPWFGTMAFWVDGTVEYLWMLIPVILFGGIYYKSYFGYDDRKRSAIGMFLLGLLSGCGLEATGCALIFGLFVMLAVKIIGKKKITGWEISGIAGELIGFATLMLAPGNYRRSDNVTELSSRYSNLFYRFARESYFTVLYLGVLFGIAVALVAVLYICRKKDKVKPGRLTDAVKDVYVTCRESIVLIVVAFVSIYVMTFVSAFAVRIFMTPTVLLIISSGITIRGIIETPEGKEWGRRFGVAIKIMMVCACIFMLTEMATSYIFCKYKGEPVTKNTQYTNTINDVRLFD